MSLLRSRPRTRIAIAVVATTLAAPAAAHAHLVQSGLGPFYDGIAHFALSPDDWLFALAIALLGGLAGKRASRWVLFALPAAWALGGVMGLTRHAVADWPAWIAATLVVTGAMVAWSPRMPDAAPAALAILLGGLHGYCNGSLAAVGGIELSGIVGVAATTFIVVALFAAAVVSLQGSTPRIVARVAGSWIAAIGLLLIGWSLRG